MRDLRSCPWANPVSSTKAASKPILRNEILGYMNSFFLVVETLQYGPDSGHGAVHGVRPGREARRHFRQVRLHLAANGLVAQDSPGFFRQPRCREFALH